MTPAIDERLKVEEFANLYGSTPEDPYYDITNDAGDPSNEYSILEPPEKAVAERLVACWNAFLGVPTAEILAKAARVPEPIWDDSSTDYDAGN